MRAVDIIMKKRGFRETGAGTLSRDEISFFINGYVAGEIPDYQMSAWLMAVYFNGMTFEETAILTDVMLHSGAVMDLSGIEGPFLDKLDAITGYKTGLTTEQFRDYIKKIGFAMTGQTKEIVPADRLIYAMRDVTATVESVPLITASILSKKVAEGAESLVFDVKCGCGAFMKTLAEAEALAKSLVGTGTAMGKKVIAMITNMNEPLGNAVGNFLEMEETYNVLQGNGPKDVTDLTLQLAGWMLVLGGKAASKEEGIQKAQEALRSGKPTELFLENVALQGGNPQQFVAECGKRRSPYTCQIKAEQDGFIAGIDAFKIGIAGVNLGVGRNKTTDAVCPDAGMILHKHAGDAVKKGDVIMDVYGKDAACLPAASDIIKTAVRYESGKPAIQPLVFKEISFADV